MSETSNKSRSVRRFMALGSMVLLIVLLGGILVFFIAPSDLTVILPIGLSAEQIASTIRSWGAWAMVGSVLLMVAHSFVPLPAEFIAIANGMVFGLILGTLLTWVGAMCGAILAFAVARFLGRRFVEAVLPGRYTAAIDEWTIEQGSLVLLVSRFLPVVSFNLINYAAGLTTVSWWTFLWTTGLGIAPLTFLMVFAGEQMFSDKRELTFILIMACVAVTLLAYLIARRRRVNRRV